LPHPCPLSSLSHSGNPESVLAGEGSIGERGLRPLSKSLSVVTGVSKRGANPSKLTGAFKRGETPLSISPPLLIAGHSRGAKPLFQIPPPLLITSPGEGDTGGEVYI
jgi:hypothetical protein